MVKIIETNTSLENKGEGVIIHDFQSRVIEVGSWNEYVDIFLTYDGEPKGNYHSLHNAMNGLSIPSNCTIKDLVYDEIHLSCICVRGNGNLDGKMAYLIREENEDELLFTGMNITEIVLDAILKTKKTDMQGMRSNEKKAYDMGISNTLSLLQAILSGDKNIVVNTYGKSREYTYEDLKDYFAKMYNKQ